MKNASNTSDPPSPPHLIRERVLSCPFSPHLFLEVLSSKSMHRWVLHLCTEQSMLPTYQQYVKFLFLWELGKLPPSLAKADSNFVTFITFKQAHRQQPLLNSGTHKTAVFFAIQKNHQEMITWPQAWKSWQLTGAHVDCKESTWKTFWLEGVVKYSCWLGMRLSQGLFSPRVLSKSSSCPMKLKLGEMLDFFILTMS